MFENHHTLDTRALKAIANANQRHNDQFIYWLAENTTVEGQTTALEIPAGNVFELYICPGYRIDEHSRTRIKINGEDVPCTATVMWPVSDNSYSGTPIVDGEGHQCDGEGLDMESTGRVYFTPEHVSEVVNLPTTN